MDQKWTCCGEVPRCGGGCPTDRAAGGRWTLPDPRNRTGYERDPDAHQRGGWRALRHRIAARVAQPGRRTTGSRPTGRPAFVGRDHGGGHGNRCGCGFIAGSGGAGESNPGVARPAKIRRERHGKGSSRSADYSRYQAGSRCGKGPAPDSRLVVRGCRAVAAGAMTRLIDPKASNAVLIGASRFHHLPDIPSVRNNVQGLAWALTRSGLSGFTADRCSELVDPSDVQSVYRELKRVAESTDDTLLIYFAGHGRIGGPQNDLHLCLGETSPDELWCTALPYEELRRLVRESPARRRLVILDCCFSGRAINDMGGPGAVHEQTMIAGSYVLTATSANKQALAPLGETYTSFTGALLQVICNGVQDGPEFLTCDDVYSHASRYLVARGLPKPRQQGSDAVARLMIARNAAYSVAASEEAVADVRDHSTLAHSMDSKVAVSIGRGVVAHQSRSTPPVAIPSVRDRTGFRAEEAHDKQVSSARVLLRSLWLLPALLGFGIFTWLAFLIFAAMRENRRWAFVAVPYFVWMVCLFVVPSNQGYMQWWVQVLFFAFWVVGGVHAFRENMRWINPDRRVSRIVSVPSHEVRQVPVRASLNRGIWVLVVAAGLGWLSGFGFLLVARRLPRSHVLLGVVPYVVWLAICIVLTTVPKSRPMPEWLAGLSFVVWVIATVHATYENRQLLAGRYRAAAEIAALS
jgi:hypothetical protein